MITHAPWPPSLESPPPAVCCAGRQPTVPTAPPAPAASDPLITAYALGGRLTTHSPPPSIHPPPASAGAAATWSRCPARPSAWQVAGATITPSPSPLLSSTHAPLPSFCWGGRYVVKASGPTLGAARAAAGVVYHGSFVEPGDVAAVLSPVLFEQSDPKTDECVRPGVGGVEAAGLVRGAAGAGDSWRHRRPRSPAADQWPVQLLRSHDVLPLTTPPPRATRQVPQHGGLCTNPGRRDQQLRLRLPG